MRNQYRNLIGLRAIASCGMDGATWYTDARSQIEDVCRLAEWDRKRFTAILAITSPRVVVRRNLRLTFHWLLEGRLPKTAMRSVALRCAIYDETGQITGPKVTAFYNVLSGDDDCIVWDVHMLALFGFGNSGRLTISQRREGERLVRSLARELQLSPAACQAVLWCGWRKIAGWNPSSYPVAEEYNRFTLKRVNPRSVHI